LPNKRCWVDIWTERSGDKIGIFIENFGLGIPKEDLERIFNSRAVARRGLHEAGRIAFAHGGKITVTSVHYTGEEVRKEAIDECITTVSVIVPLA
jgi:signal transduction histidine kinase